MREKERERERKKEKERERERMREKWRIEESSLEKLALVALRSNFDWLPALIFAAVSTNRGP